MPVYQTRLKSRADVAERTMAFQLEKPSGFQFKPGQYLDLTLIDSPRMDSQGAVRTLSIASAPYDEDLLIATRLRDSAFKRLIATLPLGTELKFEGPPGVVHSAQEPGKGCGFLGRRHWNHPFPQHRASSN